MAPRLFGSDNTDGGIKPPPINRVWFNLYSCQFPAKPQIPKRVWADGTMYLNSVIKQLRIPLGEAKDLITWWWLYKVPILRHTHKTGPFSADPRPLAKVYQEYSIWHLRNLTRLQQSTLEQVCLEDLEAMTQSEGWTPPQRWDH